MQSPPKILEKILELLLHPSESFHLMGCYEELYREKLEESNLIIAVIWYSLQILLQIPNFIKENIVWGIVMFFNNLKITLRNIGRSKVFTFTSVLSLMIGITAILYAAVVNQKARSTDQFYKNIKNIYRLGEFNTVAPIKTVIKENVPEVAAVDFFDDLWYDLTINTSSPVKVTTPIIAGPDFETIFSVQTLEGNLKEALTNPLCVALTKSEADKIFGSESPIGEVLKYNEKTDITIKAVIADQPENSTIKYGALLSSSSLPQLYKLDPVTDWNNWNYSIFMLVKENVNIEELEDKINSVLNANKPERVDELDYSLHPLDGLNLNPALSMHEFYVSNSMLLVISFIAILILVTGILNYTNMSIARAAMRAKEICIRKTTGASRGSLFKLFISESLAISLLAIIGSVLTVNILIQKLNENLDTNLISINFFDPVHFIALLLLTLIVAITAGIYPAYFLTSIEPVKILKGETLLSRKNNRLKKGFIVFQITVSVFLIMCSMVINDQLSFILNRDPGFKTDGIIYFSPSNNIVDRIDVFKNELLSHDNITKVSSGFSTLAGTDMTWGKKMIYQGEEKDVWFTCIPVDKDYIDFMGLEIVEGRNFLPSDTVNYIVNETFVKRWCPENPLEANFKNGDHLGKLVGIVKDFNCGSLKENIEPTAFVIIPNWIGAINVQLGSMTTQNISETIKFIENKWYTFSPDIPFEYDFVDEKIKRFYQLETELQTAAMITTIVAILIAAMGLFSFVTFSIERRTKEIGIRKVLGASELKIVKMMGGEFLLLTGLAVIIAIPCSYFLMNKWLDNFVYKSEIGLQAILISVIISFIITFSVVAFKILKAARNNPVDSLKCE